MEHPEAQERPELVPLVVEAIVFASLYDSEEKKAGETRAPDHNEEGVDDLACIVMTGECKSNYGEDHEVCSTCEVCMHRSALLWSVEGYIPVSLSNLSENAMEKKNS